MRCFFCDEERDCQFRPDPFAYDVHDDGTQYWICDECVYERRMEV